MLNRVTWVIFGLLIASILARGYLEYLDRVHIHEREALTAQFHDLMLELKAMESTQAGEASSPIPQITNQPTETKSPISTPKPITNHQSEEIKKKIINRLGIHVLGEIQIPRIQLAYIILDEASEENLKISISKFYGPGLHEPGNVVLAGHNMYDGSMFGLLPLVQIGDEVQLTDMQGVSQIYEVIAKDRVKQDDLSPLFKYGQDGAYVTLITCDTNDEYRVIYYAKMKAST